MNETYKEKFIKKSLEKFGDVFDFSETEFVNSKTKITFKCKICGNKYTKFPDNFFRSNGCSFCYKKKKDEETPNDYEFFVETLEEVNKITTPVLKTRIKFNCEKCGKPTECGLKIFRQSRGANRGKKENLLCAECGNPFNQKGFQEKMRQLNLDSGKTEFFKKFEDLYDFSKFEYVNGLTPSIVICKKCGCEFSALPRDLIAGYTSCRNVYCENSNRYDQYREYLLQSLKRIEAIEEELDVTFNDKFTTVWDKETKQMKKYKWICNSCGNELISPVFANDKSHVIKCPDCSLSREEQYHQTVMEKMKPRVKDLENRWKINILDEYRGKAEDVNGKKTVIKYRLKCQECGYEWRQSISWGRCLSCPECNPREHGSSKEEQTLRRMLEASCDYKIVANDREVLDGKEIDIYFSELNKGIEYDGEYWHQDKEDDKAKDELALAKGIKILRISDKDFTKDPEGVINECLDFLNNK